MTPEQRVAVVTDSCCSIRPEDELAQKYEVVTIVPVEIKFFENNQYVPYSDFEIPPQEFYQRMRTSEKLPQTSGAITGRTLETSRKLSKETNSIISIHVTSKHSVVWESVVLGKKIAQEEIPELLIEVIDSKQLSLGLWFLVEHAAILSKKGANLEQIKNEVLEMIPKIQLLAVLESLENLKRGGRADELVKAYLASLLSIHPILGVKEGKLEQFARERTVKRAREKMVEMVGDSGKLVKMAVLHTNAPEMAKGMKENLAKTYKGEIPIYEAGPVLGVHAGEGAVGVAFQRA